MIGRRLAAALRGDGDDVWVLSRRAQPVPLPEGVTQMHWDGLTPYGWGHLMDKIDVVVNLAGENIGQHRWSQQRKQTLRLSRLEPSQALVAAVEQAHHRPTVFLQASAVGYYGPLGDSPVDESATAGKDFLARLCVEWEEATKPVEGMGVRRIILRTGMVLAKDEGVLPRLVLPYKLLVGLRMGNGRQWFPWIHIRDEVDAIRFLIQNPKACGAFNLSAPSPVTNDVFGRTLGAVLGRPYGLPMPAPLLRAMLGEMATLVLDGQRALPMRLRASGFSFSFTRLQDALEDLLPADAAFRH